MPDARSHPPTSAPPLRERVCVVVVTRDRARTLRRTLARLRALADPPHVVVVDDASQDDTRALVARAFPDVELVRRDRHEGPVARNHGARRARTPYLAFCDDDCWWEPGALERAAGLLDANPRVAVVAPRIVVGDDARLDPICEEMARSPVSGDRSVPGVPILSFMGGAAVVRRSAFEEAGGFEPRLRAGGEEEPLAVDMAAAGWELRYVDDVVAHHHPPGAGDKSHDRMLGIRNTLWFAWRRRPLVSALRWTAHVARSMALNRRSLAAFARALGGLPWVLRTRRVVPRDVEADLRALDRDKMSSRARTYG